MAADVEHSFAVLAPFGATRLDTSASPAAATTPRPCGAIAGTHATVVQYDDVADDPWNNDSGAISANVLRQARDGAIVVLAECHGAGVDVLG